MKKGLEGKRQQLRLIEKVQTQLLEEKTKLLRECKEIEEELYGRSVDVDRTVVSVIDQDTDIPLTYVSALSTAPSELIEVLHQISAPRMPPTTPTKIAKTTLLKTNRTPKKSPSKSPKAGRPATRELRSLRTQSDTHRKYWSPKEDRQMRSAKTRRNATNNSA